MRDRVSYMTCVPILCYYRDGGKSKRTNETSIKREWALLTR
jgi:hypothetical protein